MTEKEAIMNFIKREDREILEEDENKITFVIFNGDSLTIYFNTEGNIECIGS